MSWVLPSAVCVGGTDYAVHTDYRDILDIIGRLTDESEPEQTRLYIALALFYTDFDSIPVCKRSDATLAMMQFINCGEIETDSRPAPKRIDWEYDQPVIVADINKVAGREIRELPYLHWWTFIAYFNAIGEGQLSTLVSIRDKRRKGQKLDDWEREYYRENKARVEWKRPCSVAEQAEKERLRKELMGEMWR